MSTSSLYAATSLVALLVGCGEVVVTPTSSTGGSAAQGGEGGTGDVMGQGGGGTGGMLGCASTCASGLCEGEQCVENLVWEIPVETPAERVVAGADGSVWAAFNGGLGLVDASGVKWSKDAKAWDVVDEPVDFPPSHLIHGAAPAPGGGVVISGLLDWGGADFGGGPLGSTSAAHFFVARFDAKANHVMSQAFSIGKDSTDGAVGVGADAAGNVFVLAEAYEDTVVGVPLPKVGTSRDLILAKLDPSGKVLVARRFGGYFDGYADYGEYERRLSIGPDGSVVITGAFLQKVGLGGPMPLLGNSGGESVFVAKYDNDLGFQWQVSLGGNEYSIASSKAYNVHVDINGNVYALAYVNAGGLELGTDTLTTTHFVASFAPDGAYRWSRPIDAKTRSMTTLPDGRVIVAGTHAEGANLGGGKLAGSGMFLLELEADGKYRWSRGFEGDSCESVAAFGPSEVVVARSGSVAVMKVP